MRLSWMQKVFATHTTSSCFQGNARKGLASIVKTTTLLALGFQISSMENSYSHRRKLQIGCICFWICPNLLLLGNMPLVFEQLKHSLYFESATCIPAKENFFQVCFPIL